MTRLYNSHGMLSNLRTAPLILALDTSSKTTSIALVEGEQALVGIEAAASDRRSERLWTQAHFLLAEAGRFLDDVQLFAVCIGPGGFTGIRVGVAAAKGFAMASGRPLIGVTSLEATALAAGPAPAVCVAIKAYRGDVYHQLFSVELSQPPAAQGAPSGEPPEMLARRIAELETLVLAGDAAEDVVESLARLGSAERVQSSAFRLPLVVQTSRLRAYDVARAAFLRFRSGEAGDSETVSACYVRPAEAEVKLSLGLVGKKQHRPDGN